MGSRGKQRLAMEQGDNTGRPYKLFTAPKASAGLFHRHPAHRGAPTLCQDPSVTLPGPGHLGVGSGAAREGLPRCLPAPGARWAAPACGRGRCGGRLRRLLGLPPPAGPAAGRGGEWLPCDHVRGRLPPPRAQYCPPVTSPAPPLTARPFLRGSADRPPIGCGGTRCDFSLGAGPRVPTPAPRAAAGHGIGLRARRRACPGGRRRWAGTRSLRSLAGGAGGAGR